VADDGRLAFRRARSHDTIAVDDCPLLAPAARSALHAMAQGWHGVSEVRLQTGTDGHAALAVTATGRDAQAPSPLPVTLRRRGHRGRPSGRARVRHRVAGHTFVVSATSFFQASTAAAEVLVGLVRELTPVTADDHVVDCYAGVGLFSVALASGGARVTAIESDPGACADAGVNAAGLPIEVRCADLAACPPSMRRSTRSCWTLRGPARARW
jgi:23S rRNA (uracil1939-C5)-methyltransferase